MNKISIPILLCSIVLLLALSPGCNGHSTEPSESIVSDTTHFPPYTRKPNIYIYPASTCSLSVELEFPLGGTIIKSVPQYLNGWSVKVDPSGKINDKYNYLFYECVNPDLYQHAAGWVVNRDSLLTFFSSNLLNAGFNTSEKNDFIEYWIPRLIEYPYYIICPQFSGDIDKIIRLKFSIKPDSILRYFYAIKGTDNPNINLKTPIIQTFKRDGFVIVEWGVVM
jgi:hypothetical protein